MTRKKIGFHVGVSFTWAFVFLFLNDLSHLLGLFFFQYFPKIIMILDPFTLETLLDVN